MAGVSPFGRIAMQSWKQTDIAVQEMGEKEEMEH